jgi:hypothetical protein
VQVSFQRYSGGLRADANFQIYARCMDQVSHFHISPVYWLLTSFLLRLFDQILLNCGRSKEPPQLINHKRHPKKTSFCCGQHLHCGQHSLRTTLIVDNTKKFSTPKCPQPWAPFSPLDKIRSPLALVPSIPISHFLREANRKNPETSVSIFQRNYLATNLL